MENKSVDFDELRGLYKNNKCAQAVLDVFASRKKKSHKTDVDRLEFVLQQAEHKFMRREVIAVLKQLQKLRCGEFIPGRRGQPSRFEWSVDMVELGKAAQGEQVLVTSLSDSAEELEEFGKPEPESEITTLRHVFMLRHDFSVVLNLPKNFSGKESQRLSEFIRTLPFNTEDQ
jgi:hypothetical protein